MSFIVQVNFPLLLFYSIIARLKINNGNYLFKILNLKNTLHQFWIKMRCGNHPNFFLYFNFQSAPLNMIHMLALMIVKCG